MNINKFMQCALLFGIAIFSFIQCCEEYGRAWAQDYERDLMDYFEKKNTGLKKDYIAMMDMQYNKLVEVSERHKFIVRENSEHQSKLDTLDRKVAGVISKVGKNKVEIDRLKAAHAQGKEDIDTLEKELLAALSFLKKGPNSSAVNSGKISAQAIKTGSRKLNESQRTRKLDSGNDNLATNTSANGACSRAKNSAVTAIKVKKNNTPWVLIMAISGCILLVVMIGFLVLRMRSKGKKQREGSF